MATEPQADYGIVTALRDELTALRAVFGATEEVQLGDRDIRYYYRALVKCHDGSEVVVVCACANDMGQQPILNLTRDLLAAWQPRHLLLIGIAGGFPGRGGSYGDLIVPLQVHYYLPGKLVPSADAPPGNEVPRIPRWRVFRASARLHAAVESLAVEEEKTWAGRIKVSRPDGAEEAVPKVLRADLASGEEVWASLESAVAQEVLAHSDKILGVENEAAAFLNAVEESPHSPDALVVKAFSDLVEGKDDRWRAYAAQVSAAFAVALIEKVGTRYGGASASLSEQGKERLEAAWKALDDLDYETTARLAEEATELALKAGDRPLESRARRQAVRAWGDHLATSRLSSQAAAPVISHIREHLQTLEQRLEIAPAHLAVEKARLKLFEQDAIAAIELAREALRIADEGTTDWADALLFATHAYWQQNRPEEALASLGELLERARSGGDLQTRLVVSTALLRTRWKAGKATAAEVSAFCVFVRELVVNEGLDRKWALLVLQEVDGELGHRDASEERLMVCELAHDLATELEDASRAAGIALEAAELAAIAGLTDKARYYLGKAASWVEHARTNEAPTGERQAVTWRAIYLFGRGRVLFRLAGQPASLSGTTATELLHEAVDVLEKAEALALDERAPLQGDIELYLADVRWWRGRTAYDLSHFAEAASLCRKVRSDAAMAHPRFSAEVGLHAWLLEAEALYLGGHPDQALAVVNSLREDSRATGTVATRARAFSEYLSERIQPLLGWLNSAEALELAQRVKASSVREVIAEQLQPLLRWWNEWRNNKPGVPHSEFLDFWARGGFIRTAAALRSRPTSAIAVDAWSLDDIRRWARVFCPLFDTVVVKWKGEIGQGMVITPMELDYGGPGCFGGHGYSVTAGTSVNSPEGNEWTVAVGWANPLPQEVASCLATEALPLFKAGRLLVVGAPLAGCTQTAVGWTDHLLVDGLLGGVVNVVGAGDSGVRGAGSQRVLDLSEVSLPYIDAVPLGDLAKVLDELAEWLDPLRSLLLKSLLSRNLRHENWQAISALESDIRDACRQLRIRLEAVAKAHQWRVAEAKGSITAGSQGIDAVGHEPITDILRAIGGGQELGPWIPYWRLQTHGGYLDWTSPIDNPSKPSPKPEVPRTSQTWLWPGTGGWVIPTAFRIPP